MRRMRGLNKFLLGLLLLLSINLTYAAAAKKVLTLQDAIALSLRNNASVRNAELDRVTQKFALFMQYWHFMPQFQSLQIQQQWEQSRESGAFGPQPTTSQTWSVLQAGMTYNSPFGTTLSISPTGLSGGSPKSENKFHPGVNITVTQQLLRGFGEAVVEAALDSAIVTNETQKLSLKNTIMTQITTTISDYMSVVEDENNIQVDKQALVRAQSNLFQTDQLIKAGQNPKSDAIQAQAQVASAKVQLQQDTSSLEIAKYTLMQTIGLKPNSVVEVSHNIPLSVFKFPKESDCVKLALKNNVSYQTSVLEIANAARTLMTDKDAARWQLQLKDVYTRGAGVAGNTGVNGILNNQNYGNTVTLGLTVPIDNMSDKQTILGDKIALEQSEISLKQGRENLIISTQSDYNGLVNDRTQIALDKKQVTYDKQNMKNAQRRYNAGIIDSLNVTTISETLSTDQQSLVAAQISYFNALATFDQSLGHALKTWGISVKDD